MKLKDGVQITPGVRKALMACESAEQIKRTAEKIGIEMSDEEAEKLFTFVTTEDLTEEDMKSVAGGCCDNYCEWDKDPGGECNTDTCGNECNWLCTSDRII